MIFTNTDLYATGSQGHAPGIGSGSGSTLDCGDSYKSGVGWGIGDGSGDSDGEGYGDGFASAAGDINGEGSRIRNYDLYNELRV